MINLGLSLDQYSKIKEQFFLDAESNSKVIKFTPRQNVSIDLKIYSILKVMKIKNLPIFSIQNKLYFVGLYKLELDIIGDFLVVKIGSKDY